MTPDSALNHYPLIVTLEDVYVPDIADLIIDAIRELDEQVCVLTITLAIDAATWNSGRTNRRIAKWR